MDEKKEIIGYYTEDGNIYCIECINKNREIMEKIEKAITGGGFRRKSVFL
jgi:hypothetical protein